MRERRPSYPRRPARPAPPEPQQRTLELANGVTLTERSFDGGETWEMPVYRDASGRVLLCQHRVPRGHGFEVRCSKRMGHRGACE
jgi:hypothetical protein